MENSITESTRRERLVPLAKAAKDIGLAWMVARTIVVLKNVPVLRHHRFWLLDVAALERFKREVELYREIDAALSQDM